MLLNMYMYEPRNYLLQKLAARKATLTKVDILEDRRMKWMEILVKSFMSSEESGSEELPDGISRQVMFVKPLPWRHPKVNQFLGQLTTINDREIEASRTADFASDTG